MYVVSLQQLLYCTNSLGVSCIVAAAAVLHQLAWWYQWHIHVVGARLMCDRVNLAQDTNRDIGPSPRHLSLVHCHCHFLFPPPTLFSLEERARARVRNMKYFYHLGLQSVLHLIVVLALSHCLAAYLGYGSGM